MRATVSLRPDAERLRVINGEVRLPDRLHAHYAVKRDLATRLRTSRREERGSLYEEVYAELFTRVHDHPQHKTDPEKRRRNTANQVTFLRPLLPRDAIFVEIGCGDAAVTQAIAASVQEAVGVDVTPALIDHAAAPINFRFVRTDGTNLALPNGSADLVYSNQLLEHLHPDDARHHLQEVFRVLRAGGRYICSTPNCLTGPHDISCYFGHEPTGFHLREYDHVSLSELFRETGFRSTRAVITVKGLRLTLPVLAACMTEKLLLGLPRGLRSRLVSLQQVKTLAGVLLIGQK